MYPLSGCPCKLFRPQRPDPLQRRDSMFQANIICLVQGLALGPKNHVVNHVSSKSGRIGISFWKTWWKPLIYFIHSKWYTEWIGHSCCLFSPLHFFGVDIFGPAKRLTRCFQASWNIHIRCNLDSLEQSWKLKTEPASSCYFFSILLSILVFFSTVLPERLEHRICCLKMKKLIYTILRLSWNNRKTTVDNYFFASCFNDLSSGLSSHCQLVLIKILILGQYVLVYNQVKSQ